MLGRDQRCIPEMGPAAGHVADKTDGIGLTIFQVVLKCWSR